MKSAVISGIPTLWVEPENANVKRLAIWLPGFSGTKESVQNYLHDLAKAGFVGLSFDPYQHGERSIETLDALRERVRGNIRRHFWPILAQTAEEAPLIIDWAVKNLGVQPEINMGGISMGGDISIAAAAVDHRIRRVAAAIATPDWMRPGSFEPPGQPDEAAQACFDRRNPLTHLADYRHCTAISFQCGADDRQVPPDGAQRFVAALSECSKNLEVCLHEGVAHAFTPGMWQNALDWFLRTLTTKHLCRGEAPLRPFSHREIL